MNVTSSNQSLILAGEPPFGRAARLVASGTASKRATILAARPNSTVVVQARPASTSFYRDPIQLYARTQRGLEDMPAAALLDVFA